MTEDRVIELIETWGADASAFPEAERAAAKALLRAQPERFAAALAQARALDRLLDQMPEILPSAALSEALIASAPKPQRAGGGWRLPKFAPWAPASGVAALASGLMMGLLIAPAASATSDTDDMQVLLEETIGYDPAAWSLEMADE